MVNSTIQDLYGYLNYTSSINSTGGVASINTLCYIAGFGINSTTSQKIIDAHIYIKDLNSTTLRFHVTSQSTVDVYVGFFFVNYIVFNPAEFNLPTVGAFYDGTFYADFVSSSSPTLTYTNSSNLYNFTTMLGLSGVHF